MGDGVCPFTQCKVMNIIETTPHIFWTCPKIQDILFWIGKTVQYLTKDKIIFNIDLFLYGFPDTNITKAIFHRIWLLFCITKFAIWKSRCLHVFEAQVQTSSVLLSIIEHEIRLRVESDFNRFHLDKFEKMWINGTSFVKIKHGKLVFNL